MCGIAGFICQSNEYSNILEDMLFQINHRGPDSFGVWQTDGVYLGHKRLAILDLSEAGHQPMMSKDQRFTITFNGEIYNYLEIKEELNAYKNINWKGNSDTEVMLEAISLWGVEKALDKFNGMFAFALWDKDLQELILARDRFGEKPLYYSSNDNGIIFSSEIFSMEKHPEIKKDLDHEAIQLYLKYKNIPAPYSIYKSIKKILPGSYISWQRETNTLTQKYYWNANNIFLEKIKNPLQIKENEALEQLDNLMTSSVKLRMISDVQIGSFLSGGFDSSLVTAIMQKNSTKSIKTFSIGFDNPLFNEAEHAKAIASYLGTDHFESYVTGTDALNVVEKLVDIYDEPFADSSQIPMYLLSKETRKHVTVSLSGDAGDELFGGYSRYINTIQKWNKINNIPLGSFFSKFSLVLPDHLKILLIKLFSSKRITLTQLDELLVLYSSKNFNEFYNAIMSSWKNCNVLSNQISSIKFENYLNINNMDLMMLEDTLNYLPNDILTKVDRACMAVSLEGRIPFLDRDVAEFAWSLPQNFKIRDGVGKYLPKLLTYKYINKDLLDRPKTGFAVPLGEWLKSDLKNWANHLLSKDKIIRQQIFDEQIITKIWNEHQLGVADHSDKLWTILMLQAWLEKRGL